ncbi:MAG: hypothetical protein K0S67_1139 [Nitrososphaeraceae archaeon]|nr:hypothetical protein [Nitrososphaeraceae archaeon]
MTAIAQTSMIAACLAILIYIAVITTGNYFTSQSISDESPLSQLSQIDTAIHEQISSNLNYSHKADTNRASLTVLLNGLQLNASEFILLYDSTPYASKGHIAVYHAQFGFGDPVTDVILKNVADRSINLTSPHSVVITTHESFLPTAPSFKDIQHQKGY